MKEVTNKLIHDFKIMKLGFDFMGYNVKRRESLSFHHLIAPKRECKEQGLGEGYFYWNGSILVQRTSHDYLHIIERADEDVFYAITSEMIDMKALGRLDLDNLRRIDDILKQFEKEHLNDSNCKGKRLIKSEYLYRRKF